MPRRAMVTSLRRCQTLAGVLRRVGSASDDANDPPRARFTFYQSIPRRVSFHASSIPASFRHCLWLAVRNARHRRRGQNGSGSRSFDRECGAEPARAVGSSASHADRRNPRHAGSAGPARRRAATGPCETMAARARDAAPGTGAHRRIPAIGRKQESSRRLADRRILDARVAGRPLQHGHVAVDRRRARIAPEQPRHPHRVFR